jgi:hypothetical protein
MTLLHIWSIILRGVYRFLLSIFGFSKYMRRIVFGGGLQTSWVGSGASEWTKMHGVERC